MDRHGPDAEAVRVESCRASTSNAYYIPPGWTSRQQFEETWAALLGVLSSPPLPENVSPEVNYFMSDLHLACVISQARTSVSLHDVGMIRQWRSPL